MPVVTPGGYGRFYDPSAGASSTNSSRSYTGTRPSGPLPFSNDGPAQPAPDLKQNFNDSSSYTGAGNQNKRLYPSVDFSNMRMENAGLNKGGANSPKSRSLNPTVNSGQTSTSLVSADDDWRIRISLPTNSSIFYQNAGASQIAMQPIIESGVNGVIFPYTPQISVAHNARYQEQSLTHSNFKNYFYEGSDVAAITISGDFTAQNEKEAAYVLSCVYFLRACTRMWFGQTASLPVGTPPTIVFLDGYGQFYFPHVSCVVTNFTHSLPNDVDYIPLKSAFQNTRIPTMSQISVTLQPVVSRKRMHEDFNLDYVAQGLLLGSKKGVGGFL
jgi:hypothetical protein